MPTPQVLARSHFGPMKFLYFYCCMAGLPCPLTPGRSVSCLWVAGYPDGAHTTGKRVENRNRRCLRPSTFLVERLGGKDEACKYLNILGHKADKPVTEIHSLVLLSQDGCSAYKGPLTDWGAEEREQWLFHDSPMDSYSVKVESVFNLQCPRSLTHKLGRSTGSSGLSRMNNIISPLCVPSWNSPVAVSEEILNASNPSTMQMSCAEVLQS